MMPAIGGGGGICVHGGVRSNSQLGCGTRQRLSNECWVLQLRVAPGEFAPSAPTPPSPPASVHASCAASAAASESGLDGITPSLNGSSAPPAAELCSLEWDGQPLNWAQVGGAFPSKQPGWPAGRAGHSATALPAPYAWDQGRQSQQGAMLIMGGYAVDGMEPDGPEGMLTMDCFLLKPSSASWRPLVPAGVAPSPRSLHSAVLLSTAFANYPRAREQEWHAADGGLFSRRGAGGIGGGGGPLRIAVFGGWGLEYEAAPWKHLQSATYLNSLHLLTLDPAVEGRCEWSTIRPPGPPPVPRCGAALLTSSEGGVLLIGGHTNEGCVSAPHLDMLALSGEAMRTAERAARAHACEQSSAELLAGQHSPSLASLGATAAEPSRPSSASAMAGAEGGTAADGTCSAHCSASREGSHAMSMTESRETSRAQSASQRSDRCSSTGGSQGAATSQLATSQGGTASTAAEADDGGPRLQLVAGSVEGDESGWSTDLLLASCRAFRSRAHDEGKGDIIEPRAADADDGLRWTRPDSTGEAPPAAARMAAVAMDDHVLVLVPPPAGHTSGETQLGPNDEPGTSLFVLAGDGIEPAELLQRFKRTKTRAPFRPSPPPLAEASLIESRPTTVPVERSSTSGTPRAPRAAPAAPTTGGAVARHTVTPEARGGPGGAGGLMAEEPELTRELAAVAGEALMPLLEESEDGSETADGAERGLLTMGMAVPAAHEMTEAEEAAIYGGAPASESQDHEEGFRMEGSKAALHAPAAARVAAGRGARSPIRAGGAPSPRPLGAAPPEPDTHPNADGFFHCSATNAAAAYRDTPLSQYTRSAHHIRKKGKGVVPPTKPLRMRVVRRLHDQSIAEETFASSVLRPAMSRLGAALDPPRPSFGTTGTTERSPFLVVAQGESVLATEQHLNELQREKDAINTALEERPPPSYVPRETLFAAPPLLTAVFASSSARIEPLRRDVEEGPAPTDYDPKGSDAIWATMRAWSTSTPSLTAPKVTLTPKPAPAAPPAPVLHHEAASGTVTSWTRPTTEAAHHERGGGGSSKGASGRRAASPSPPDASSAAKADVEAPGGGGVGGQAGLASKGLGYLAEPLPPMPPRSLSSSQPLPARSQPSAASLWSAEDAQSASGYSEPEPVFDPSFAKDLFDPNSKLFSTTDMRPPPYFARLPPSYAPGPGAYFPRTTRRGDEFVVPASPRSALARETRRQSASFLSASPRALFAASFASASATAGAATGATTGAVSGAARAASIVRSDRVDPKEEDDWSVPTHWRREHSAPRPSAHRSAASPPQMASEARNLGDLGDIGGPIVPSATLPPRGCSEVAQVAEESADVERLPLWPPAAKPAHGPPASVIKASPAPFSHAAIAEGGGGVRLAQLPHPPSAPPPSATAARRARRAVGPQSDPQSPRMCVRIRVDGDAAPAAALLPSTLAVALEVDVALAPASFVSHAEWSPASPFVSYADGEWRGGGRRAGGVLAVPLRVAVEPEDVAQVLLVPEQADAEEELEAASAKEEEEGRCEEGGLAHGESQEEEEVEEDEAEEAVEGELAPHLVLSAQAAGVTIGYDMLAENRRLSRHGGRTVREDDSEPVDEAAIVAGARVTLVLTTRRPPEEVEASVERRMGQRLRLQHEYGHCWAEVKDITSIVPEDKAESEVCVPPPHRPHGPLNWRPPPTQPTIQILTATNSHPSS